MANTLIEPTETQGMLRPNTKQAENAIIGLKCVLIMEFVSIFFLYLEYSLLSSVSSKPTSEEAINANYDQQQFFSIISLFVYFISIVTFLKWFRRAYYNLGIRVSSLSCSNIRAAISWFIPIVSIYKPYQILKEMYRKTNYLLVQRYPETEGILPMKLLHVWWFFYIVLNIIAFILTYLYLNIDSVKDILTINGINTAFSLVNISLSILTIKVVRRYAEAERLMARIRDENNEI